MDNQTETDTHLVYTTLGVLQVCLPDTQHMGFIGKETLHIVFFSTLKFTAIPKHVFFKNNTPNLPKVISSKR